MLKTGVLGATVAAICCFTPLLAWLLGGLGLATLLAWADLVVMAAPVLFLAMIGAALWKRRPSRT